MVNFHGCTLPRGRSRMYPHLMTAEAPKQFLKDVPAAWDDTRFLAGFPGRYVVLARRQGDQWFIGCLSGHDTTHTLDLDLGFLGSDIYTAIIITDGSELRKLEMRARNVMRSDRLQVTVQKYGGFVIQIESWN
ncbi:MAG: glycoside hydrolase family 97 C-terminal domain-containing protein [Phycisphaerales bacterium]|nr:MAG: glycoside hydrolase family 97 C-terminal domain-containing protein [Phycisphaerales bacterium]